MALHPHSTPLTRNFSGRDSSIDLITAAAIRTIDEVESSDDDDDDCSVTTIGPESDLEVKVDKENTMQKAQDKNMYVGLMHPSGSVCPNHAFQCTACPFIVCTSWSRVICPCGRIYTYDPMTCRFYAEDSLDPLVTTKDCSTLLKETKCMKSMVPPTTTAASPKQPTRLISPPISVTLHAAATPFADLDSRHLFTASNGVFITTLYSSPQSSRHQLYQPSPPCLESSSFPLFKYEESPRSQSSSSSTSLPPTSLKLVAPLPIALPPPPRTLLQVKPLHPKAKVRKGIKAEPTVGSSEEVSEIYPVWSCVRNSKMGQRVSSSSIRVLKDNSSGLYLLCLPDICNALCAQFQRFNEKYMMVKNLKFNSALAPRSSTQKCNGLRLQDAIHVFKAVVIKKCGKNKQLDTSSSLNLRRSVWSLLQIDVTQSTPTTTAPAAQDPSLATPPTAEKITHAQLLYNLYKLLQWSESLTSLSAAAGASNPAVRSDNAPGQVVATHAQSSTSNSCPPLPPHRRSIPSNHEFVVRPPPIIRPRSQTTGGPLSFTPNVSYLSMAAASSSSSTSTSSSSLSSTVHHVVPSILSRKRKSSGDGDAPPTKVTKTDVKSIVIAKPRPSYVATAAILPEPTTSLQQAALKAVELAQKQAAADPYGHIPAVTLMKRI